MTNLLTDHLKIISNYMRSSFMRASGLYVLLLPEFPAAKRVSRVAGFSNVWMMKWVTDTDFSFTQNFYWVPGNCILWFSSCSCSAWVPFACFPKDVQTLWQFVFQSKLRAKTRLPAYLYLLRQNDFSLSSSFVIIPNPKLNYLVF